MNHPSSFMLFYYFHNICNVDVSNVEKISLYHHLHLNILRKEMLKMSTTQT